METMVLSPRERLEYEEFKRNRREAEIALTLGKLTVDASRRETDKYALKRACETAKKLHAYGVLVSPVHVVAARRLLAGCATQVVCVVGGTGESLSAIKKTEAKKAAKQGAHELRLVLCYSELRAGNVQYLKREIKKVRKAARNCALTVSLEDHSFGEEELMKGVRAACDAGANGVCVRGEIPLVLRAVKTSAGKVRVDVSGVENAEQLRNLMKAGALRATTYFAEQLCSDLYRNAREEAVVLSASKLPPDFAPAPDLQAESEN